MGPLSWRQRRAGLAMATAALVALVSGCVSPAAVPAAMVPGPLDGTVLLSVTTNTPRLGQLQNVTLRPEQDKGRTGIFRELRNVGPGLSRDTAVFAGVVPAGEYTLNALRVANTAVLFRDGARELLGTFRVKAGEVCDLGRVIVTPINDRVLVGRSRSPVSNSDLIRVFSPENASALRGAVASGWSTPQDPDDRIESYALDRPMGAMLPSELASGEVVAASRLGTLLVRDRGGQWRAARTGSLDALMATAAVPEGRVDGLAAQAVAVGEFSGIYRYDGTPALQPLSPGNLPPGHLIGVIRLAEEGWVVVHRDRTRITLLRSQRLDRGNWQPLRTYQLEHSVWSGPDYFWFWPAAGGLAIAMADGRVERFDARSGSWSPSTSPGQARLTGLRANGRGAVGVLTSPGGGFGGVFAGSYLSVDDGRTWQDLPQPFQIKVVPPFLLFDESVVVTGGILSTPELQVTRNRGKTWERRSTDVGVIEPLFQFPNAGLFAVDETAYGLTRIRHSSDMGATWRVEYSTFDRAAYESQQRR